MEINIGETIKWNGVTGVVQSKMPNDVNQNWYSPFVNNGAFFKKFTQKGTYEYQIAYIDYIFNGKIIVN
jgi:hypothetical protein